MTNPLCAEHALISYDTNPPVWLILFNRTLGSDRIIIIEETYEQCVNKFLHRDTKTCVYCKDRLFAFEDLLLCPDRSTSHAYEFSNKTQSERLRLGSLTAVLEFNGDLQTFCIIETLPNSDHRIIHFIDFPAPNHDNNLMQKASALHNYWRDPNFTKMLVKFNNIKALF